MMINRAEGAKLMTKDLGLNESATRNLMLEVMPSAFETIESQKYRTSSVKCKLQYFRDENNGANMNGIETLVSSNITIEEEPWQQPQHSNCSSDHCENLISHALPCLEQSSCLSHLSLFDQGSTQTEEFIGSFDLIALQKKLRCADKKEVDKNKWNIAGGFHRRQDSGDLYIKLECFDNGDFVASKKQNSSKFQSNRYVVTGNGSWGDFDDSFISKDIGTTETTVSESSHIVKPIDFNSTHETSSSDALCLKEGFKLNSSTGGVGGVFGLKEWYKNRTLVLKATSKVEAPPKSKYLRKLVLSSWRHNGDGGATIFNILGKRPLQFSPVIALKALITIHKLMQQGSPSCRVICYNRLQILIDTRNNFQNLDDSAIDSLSYKPLICAYASMLLEKATFHHRYQAYENNYSFDLDATKDKPTCSGQTFIDPLRPHALLCLQGLQDLILRILEEGFALFRKMHFANGEKNACTKTVTPYATVGSRFLTMGGMTDPMELVVSVLIPVLREADLVYDICCFLLTTQLSIWSGSKFDQENKAMLNEMVPKFDYQHRALRVFFEEAKTIDAISCNVTPPNLPQNPSYPIEYAAIKFLRLLPKTDDVVHKDPDTLHYSRSDVDFLTELESARSKSVEGAIRDNIVVSETDISWSSVPTQVFEGGKILVKKDMKGLVLGGVGAAAAAAMQRFAAGQAEAKRVIVSESVLTAPPELRNIRLEPPPGNTSNSFHLELGTITRPERPHHMRGTGRTWSSFDDQAFLHQHVVENPCSPIARLVTPKFYSPRAQKPLDHDVGGLLSPIHVDSTSPFHVDSTSPLLLGFVSASSSMNKPIDPFIGSPSSANLAMEVIPSPRLAIVPPCEVNHHESRYPEPQAQARYCCVEPVPLIELEVVDEKQLMFTEPQVINGEGILSKQDFLRNEISTSWQVEESMSDATAWKGPHKVGYIGKHNRKTSLSDIPFAADWEIPICQLKLGPKIGQGAFGDVLRGTWQGTDVAVKRLQNNASYSQAIVAIRHEVAVIMRLRHPNIILFMGACTVPPDICIVMEFAANGSLYGVLHNPNISIDMVAVVRWASEAARGMNYLHTRNPPIVHRDLKSVNLLVDGDWHIKVSDFGLAITKQSSYAYTQVGTWGWMAPEVLDLAPYDEKADVYSFGVVLWELITREEPFRGYHPMQIMRAIDRGDRPTIPESCPHRYRDLVQDCWQKDPNGRPKFEEILSRLGAMSINLLEIQR